MLVSGSEVFTVSPDTTVLDALRLMADKDVGAVVVLSNSRLVGIFTERDYARKVVLVGKASRNLPVSEIMSTDVVTIDPSWTTDRCMALMDERRIRHLPVVDGGKVVGVVSIRGVVSAIVAEQRYTIQHLEKYISSGA
ncbi:MAG: CBS domain-containing protein [Acidobacteria bacterium]|nr:CBS domain-containing protein [Acidobacteriota bacterium]